MEQFETIKEIIEKDKNNYTFKEVAEMFVMTFDIYQENSKTCKNIKSKIPKQEWNSLVNGLTTSFLLSLHTSKMSVEEALKYSKIDGCIGIGVVSKKNNK